MSTPKLQMTRNYSLFVMSRLNRPLHDRAALLQSMKLYGFMPSKPIHVRRLPDGKLEIQAGHHRFETAKELNIPVYYVVDETPISLVEMEAPGSQWTGKDYAYAYAQAGKPDYGTLIEFHKRTGIKLNQCGALLTARAQSGAISDLIKSGKFRATNVRHAEAVVSVVQKCVEHKIPFAKDSRFVAAVSVVCMVPDFSPEVLIGRIKIYPKMMVHRATRDEYVEEIDAIYNYNARGRRLQIATAAKAIMSERGTITDAKRELAAKANRARRANGNGVCDSPVSALAAKSSS
jgi:hypothetical protein